MRYSNRTPVQMVEVSVVIKRETEKAYLVNHGVSEEVWIPKSQIDDYTEENGAITSVFIPEWLAEEKGMV